MYDVSKFCIDKENSKVKGGLIGFDITEYREISRKHSPEMAFLKAYFFITKSLSLRNVKPIDKDFMPVRGCLTTSHTMQLETEQLIFLHNSLQKEHTQVSTLSSL